jgi:hypothetical protein
MMDEIEINMNNFIHMQNMWFMWLGENTIKGANKITLKNDCESFLVLFHFFLWIFFWMKYFANYYQKYI